MISSFPGLVLADDTVNSESLVRVKPGDSCAVIGYQVDIYSHLISRMFCCLIGYLPQVHWQGVNLSHLML